MSKTAEQDFSHLPPAAGRLGAVFARPKALAIACVLALAGLGWLYLALLVANMGGAIGALGPGMAVLDLVPRAIAALCRPTFGLAMPEGVWGAGGFAVVALMWAAMMLAMMLPSASPMILTYAEIAETAARKGERIVSPLLIAAGYTVVWLGFAAVATLAQFILTRAALLDAGMASASGLFSGAIFIGAGLYQFSALKHACLRAMPAAVSVLLRALADQPTRRVRARTAAGALLSWLLLGDDAGDVRGRRDERDLDGGARHGDDAGEDRPRQPLHLRYRRRADCGRRRFCARGLRCPLAAAHDLS